MAPFTEAKSALDRVDPLENQIAEFVELMKGKAEPTVTIDDGYRNLAVVEAIKKAAESGSLEEVEY